MQLRSRLSTTCKGDMTAVAYFDKMKGYADEMAAAGKPLEDEDFIAHLLAGLDYEYNSFVENVSSRSDPITIVMCMHSFSLLSPDWIMRTRVFT
jgi:hypothetical protein